MQQAVYSLVLFHIKKQKHGKKKNEALSPIESLGPLHVENFRKGGDDLEVCDDDLGPNHEGVLPLLDELEHPGARGRSRQVGAGFEAQYVTVRERSTQG